MTTWNDRLLPYPLLAPWNDDYKDAAFVAQVPHAVLNNGEQISLTVKYHLTSPALQGLVIQDKAQYVGLVTCAETFKRDSYATAQEEELYILNAANYAKELKLTPYVVATQPIEGFIAPEHNVELRRLKPNGFDISSGSILAVGISTNVTLEEGTPYSVIDLVADPTIDAGMFKVGFDDNRLKVYMEPSDKGKTEALRKSGQNRKNSKELAILFPSIYLHAITEALRRLSEHPDQRWTRTMQKALERNGIDVDEDELKINALTYAQILMEKPVGPLMTALERKEE